jgi:hypothetical protein
VYFSKNSFEYLHQLLCLIIFFHACDNDRVCQNLGRYILVLELDMEVFLKVFEQSTIMDMSNFEFNHIHKFDNDFFVKKR